MTGLIEVDEILLNVGDGFATLIGRGKGVGNAGKVTLPCLVLRVFSGPGSGEAAKPCAVKNEGVTGEMGTDIGFGARSDLMMKFFEHGDGECFATGSWLLPFAPLIDDVSNERDKGGLFRVGKVDGEGVVDHPAEKVDGGIGIVGKGVRHGEVAFAVVGCVRYVAEIGGNDADDLGLGEGLKLIEVADPANLFEPLEKMGGSIVHSSVVAVSYHSSVCSLK